MAQNLFTLRSRFQILKKKREKITPANIDPLIFSLKTGEILEKYDQTEHDRMKTERIFRFYLFNCIRKIYRALL